VHIEGYDFVVILMLVVLEGLLSADNAMVLAVLALGLPKSQRKRSLRYGVVGAFAFRSAALLFGLYLIGLSLVKLVGALYLLYLPFRHFAGERKAEGGRSIPTATAWLGLSPFWATVVKVELTDIVFAIDSIVVAVAMSQKTWVVLSGGILGIVAMRLVVGQLLSVVERYPALVDGAFVIIAWVGTRLLLQYLHQVGVVSWEVPEWLGYGLIVAIFLVALAWGRVEEKRKGRRDQA
jgi:YkoY family integral membrane protein